MKLSIIIVNYNTGVLTRALVESLLKHRLPNATEIIVVDNDSKDESISLLRSDFPEITVIDNGENLGLAAGVNRGIKEATGTYYLVLNPDMIAMPDAVQTLVDFMDKNLDIGMAGGKLLSPNGRLQYSCFRFYRPLTILYRRTFLGKTRWGKSETSRFLMKDFDHKSVRDVDWLMGACLMLRADAVGNIDTPSSLSDASERLRGTPTGRRPVGGMDERFFLYFEDVDWGRRMWEAGWRVTFVPDAQFSHFYQQSSKRGALFGILTNRVTREHIKSAFKYFWKFRGKELPHTEIDR